MRAMRRLRQERGLTQARLAGIVGCTDTMIRYIETGKKRGSIDTLEAIAAALKVSVEELRKEEAAQETAERPA